MSKYKGRLIVLGVLVVVLALVAVLLARKTPQTQAISGGFSYITSIYGVLAPFGVATDVDQNIYVSNTGKSEVDVYDKDGNFQFKVDTKDQDGNPLQFRANMADIAVDDSRDRVYVCDYNFRGVRVLNKAGDFQFNLPRDPKDFPAGQLFAPYGIAIYGDKEYVTSWAGIYIFDADGKYVGHWGTDKQGKDKGQFNYAEGIVVDPNTGNFFVADSLNRRIVALNSSGQVRWMVGSPDVNGNITSPFGLPKGIALGPDGNVYVSDNFNNQFVVLTQDGDVVSVFGEKGDQNGQVNFPDGIAITSTKRFYICDRMNNRIQIWQLPDTLPQPDPSQAASFKKAFIKGDAP